MNKFSPGNFIARPQASNLFILPVIFILIVAAGFLYFKFQKPASKTDIATQPAQVNLPAGVTEATKTAAEHSNLIGGMKIQQSIQGKLVEITQNSWTLQSGNQTLTVTHQGANKVRYARMPKNASSSAQPVSTTEIKPEDLKIGDNVLIIRLLNWDNAASVIAAVTVLP